MGFCFFKSGQLLPSLTGVRLALNPPAGSARVCLFQLTHIHTIMQSQLYMGGTIIPGMAVGWREERHECVGGGEKKKLLKQSQIFSSS